MSFILVDTVKVKYKQKYCGNRNYFTSGNYYPHLHCYSDALLLSYKKDKSTVDHVYFANGNDISCSRVMKVLNQPVRYGSCHKNQRLWIAIRKFADENCKKEMETFDENYYNMLMEDNESKKKKPPKNNKMSKKQKMIKKLEKTKKKHKKNNKNKIRDGF